MLKMKYFSQRALSACLGTLIVAMSASTGLGAEKVYAPLEIVYGKTMPGEASAKQTGNVFTLSNNYLEMDWTLDHGRLMLTRISDKVKKLSHAQSNEVFALKIDKSTQILASECGLSAQPVIESIKPLPNSACAAKLLPGKRIVAKYKHQGSGLSVQWEAELRNGSHYVRQIVKVEGSKGTLTEVTSFKANVGSGWNEGTALAGNPVCTEHLFMGQELPMSKNVAMGGGIPDQWSPTDMMTKVINRKVKDLQPGQMTVRFDYQRGIFRIDVAEVQLVVDGKVISKDEHAGWSGLSTHANEYKLTVPDGITKAELVVRLGGSPKDTDSFGKITCSNGELQLGKPGPVSCELSCKLPLSAGKTYEVSSVLGTYPVGQRRRAFLRYLERERARPYKPFLHYNCWFDLERGINEKDMLSRIGSFTEEMTLKRGVAMQSYVLDDGWDDFNAGFWAIHKTKFPNGFDKLAEELARVHSHLGIWISPLAGYGGNEQRVAQARKLGLVSGGWLDLSDEKYYKWFRDFCADQVVKNKVNYFKWDKAGGGVSPHFMALLACARELRQIDPDLFLNVTVGTWPSPFWLNVIDSTWREGGDMGWEGKGDDREMWLNYRDAQTYRFVVKQGPLYPLNSIMNHGVVMAKGHFYAARAAKAGNDLRNEARSFFGCGTALQELYIQPNLMATSSWDTVASAAKWAKMNADVLVDTHWVGGNPEKQEIYGWASWSPRKAILTLRNPNDQPQEIKLDAAKVFELPSFAAKKFTMTSPYADQRVQKVEMKAGTPTTFAMQPFEVLVLESKPTKF